MFEKVTIDDIRKPAGQALNLFALFMIFFTSITLFNGLDYEDIPLYLKISTLMQLIIIIISILQWIPFVKINHTSSKLKKKRYAKFLSIINVLSCVNAILTFNNLFYYMGIQHNVDLFEYWLRNTVTMIISFLLLSIGALMMLNEGKIIARFANGKTRSKIGLVALLLSKFIYITKFIEYLSIPNIADSKFLVSGSILIIIPLHFVTFMFIKRYVDYKIVEKIMIVE
ncbi:DUF5079 family protein [Staphylococcus chromogenes]|uniref:DUF5079 family protein n=1 Tax=Staphylococcus chromogenes TaxID=46126 RepID=UPI000D1BE295|nr:DUF5079 family protein [Staphylococcus chromogenes]MCE5044124.1 DUF5079 family protein [Staphylococcus chromogenes]MDT0680474.1 DUF5079 family protein [Staphylococcus chromogenes]MDT0715737.1 DUF5079 family protein [Staphylococcus chromogenes]MDT0735941.1 DUF5079 family protein [Staphylococcus chromogenes]MDT0749312.1 DUF5079 family protein [Staphylococcus chromogenes]